jgi:taurine dioxygenase
VKLVPTGRALGAKIEGVDLSGSLEDRDVESIIQSLGRYGVLCFPRQRLSAAQQKAFAARFGELEINVAGTFQEPGIPEVMILSNIVRGGKPVGMADAGQDWHTDMSYSKTIAFANVLYALEVPRRNGKTLGDTEFSSMHAAYEGLPENLKQKLDGMTVLHDFNKFWEMMRREKGSKRPPLTEAQRKAKPPVSHPIFLKHPITGRKVLYANPGYSMRINELPEKDSDEMLKFLFEHQVKPEYRYRHQWTEGDLLMWENFGLIHNAIADYAPDEHRLIRRCQVMATRFAL